MTHHSHHRWLPHALAALLLGLLVLTVPGTAQATEVVPPGKAWVRVGHFVPGMGTTSIEVKPLDGASAPMTLAGNATYGDVSTYEKLAPGRYTATVSETSAGTDAAPVLSRSFEITSSEARTIAVIGTSDAPRLVLLSDDLTPPEPGTARVRLLSAFEGADSVTVTAVGGPTITEGAVLGQATDYTTVPAGSWTLQLQSSTASASLQEVDVTSGSVYTVVALDSGSQEVELQVITDAAGAAVAPKGGAKTGGGGAAIEQVAPISEVGSREAQVAAIVVALSAAVGMLALVGRRRRVQVAR